MHLEAVACAIADEGNDLLAEMMQVDPHLAHARHRQPAQVAFEHRLATDLDQRLGPVGHHALDAAALAGGQHQRTRQRRRDRGLAHRLNPAPSASRWNIWTVSSEY